MIINRLKCCCYCLSGMLLLGLTACSHSSPQSSRFTQYAATLPPITVPADIKNPTAESYYPVPAVALTAPVGTMPPLAPPGSNLTVQKKVPLPAPTK